MLGETTYLEAIKGCAKWNTRCINERKVVRYVEYPWKQRASAPPSDKPLYAWFVRQNPAIAEAASRQGNNPISDLTPVNDNSLDAFVAQELAAAQTVRMIKPNSKFPGDDEFSLSDPGSDGDDWGTRRKGKKKQGKEKNKKSSSSARASSQPRPPSPSLSGPHPCEICSAVYKSKPGLIHHRAYWHEIFPPPNAPPPYKLFSPNVEVSTECDVCTGTRFKNKQDAAEELVTCHDCGRSFHPSCLTMSENTQRSTERFGWQCIECKSCAICGTSENDDKLLFCDDCDRGFHLYCLRPPLNSAPEGMWSCHMCKRAFGPKASAPDI